MSPEKAIGMLFMLVHLSGSATATTDWTIQPKSKGEDVTDAVVHKIHQSGIFPEDQGFLRRVAYVESKFGEDPGTYRAGYYGGIWQVDQIGFKDTQNVQSHPSLQNITAAIQAKFNIIWMEVTWQDLEKPLYSGLASRLFLLALPEPIPGTLNQQAEYWKKYYHKDGQGTVEKFIADVQELESSNKCRGRMELCIVLDSSGSIGSADFQVAKEFVRNFIDTFSLDTTRIGFIVYSSSVSTVFSIGDNMTKSEMMDSVTRTAYQGGSTNTNEAIMGAIRMLNGTKQMDGIPKVITVFTDGKSNNGVTGAVSMARSLNFFSFAIGIGSNIDPNELLEIAYGNPSAVFSLTSFNALAEFFYRLNFETCILPQRPAIEEVVTDELVRNETRYYNFDLPIEGITIWLTTIEGQLVAYYSYTEEIPSKALNDGQIPGPTFIRQPALRHRRQSTGSQLFISVKGSGITNKYTIKGNKGDTTTDSSSLIQVSFWLINVSVIVLVKYIF